ncbi:hypothetical protein [Mesorhizobium sp.]|nr:hypothetical protein [Mesorhizobium sp.]
MMISTAYALLFGYLAGFTCGAAVACAILYAAKRALVPQGE